MLRLEEVVDSVIGLIGRAIPDLHQETGLLRRLVLKVAHQITECVLVLHSKSVSTTQVSYLCELVHRVVRYIEVEAILLLTKLVQAVQEAAQDCT